MQIILAKTAGFFHYDDLNFEQFLVAVVESVILGMPLGILFLKFLLYPKNGI